MSYNTKHHSQWPRARSPIQVTVFLQKNNAYESTSNQKQDSFNLIEVPNQNEDCWDDEDNAVSSHGLVIDTIALPEEIQS